MNISILTNVKDEPDVREWCYYHIFILKFDHIYICDNDSKTPVRQIIKNDYKLASKVTVFEIPGQYVKNKSKQCFFSQFARYSEWTLFIDADEYLVLKDIDNIHDFIDQQKFQNKNIDCITFNWKFMGSNKLLKRPKQLVIEAYTDCKTNFFDKHVKSLVRNNAVISYLDMPHILKVQGNIVDSNGNPKDTSSYNTNMNQEHCIFHYWCKSREDWINKCDLVGPVLDDGSVSTRIYDIWNETTTYEYTDDYLKVNFTEELKQLMK